MPRGVWIPLTALALMLVAIGSGLTPRKEDSRATPTPTVERSYPARTPRPQVYGTPYPTPARTVVVPRPSPTGPEVFEVWYAANGFPEGSLGEVVRMVRNVCRQLEGGAEMADIFDAIRYSVDRELWSDVTRIIGAGVQGYCPDQRPW